MRVLEAALDEDGYSTTVRAVALRLAEGECSWLWRLAKGDMAAERTALVRPAASGS